MLKVHIKTFGCQMNVADSEMLAQQIVRYGYATAEDADTADLIVVNTCSVRRHAEQRAISRITEYANRKRKLKKNQQIWVVGCMAQRLGDQILTKIPGIDRVIGAMEIESAGRHIADYLNRKEQARHAISRPAAISVLVPVMRGCNNFCTYCIVPYVRGKEHSIGGKKIEDTVRKLVDKGAREITLLGQNVNSYYDRSTGYDFPDLLSALHAVRGLERIRFTTSHPKDCSLKLIRTVASLPGLCSHIHLPVQSGSTRILKSMNRGYTREDYLDRIDLIRKLIPHADITTDIMTGFPGETGKDFDDTLSLIEEVRFTSAFMFAYSPRPGTEAIKLDSPVPPAESRERLRQIIETQTRITREHYQDMVGQGARVLFTQRQNKHDKIWAGQTHGAKRALLACRDNIAGMIFDVTVTGSTGMTLLCERIQ